MKNELRTVSCIGVLLLAVASMQAQTVTGSGTTGTLPVFTGSSKIGNSVISQSGSNVTVNDTLIVKGAVQSHSAADMGVDASSNSNIGVLGQSGTSTAVEGLSTSSFGVKGLSNTGVGVEGEGGPANFGVEGISKSSSGVVGFSTSGFGVEGNSNSNVGVSGTSTSFRGVQGNSSSKSAVAGISTGGDGISGATCTSCSGPAAVVGIGKLAGAFTGAVGVTGDFSVTGVKAFHIDHPLDPANKYLNHFAIESNEVLNTYSGNVTTDASGTAVVELPEYFEALNTNYRYQLTVLGQFAQAIVLREIQSNNFVIKTDKPGVKVSWQVTGVRSDANVKAHPMPVEQAKPPQERGYYLTPEVFGQPAEKSLSWLYHADLMRDARNIEVKRKAQALGVD